MKAAGPALILAFSIAAKGAPESFSYPGGVAELWLPKQSQNLPTVRYGLSEPAIIDQDEQWRVLIGIDLDRLPGDYVVYTHQDSDEESIQFSKISVAHKNYPLQEAGSRELVVLPNYEKLSELDFNNSQPPKMPMTPPFSANWSADFGQRLVLRKGDQTQAQNYTYATANVRTLVKAPQAGIVSKIVAQANNTADIVLDHGRGIYSILYGLGDLAVQLGNGVRAGAVIGKVPDSDQDQPQSATANRSATELRQATVYWQVQLNGVFVNPLILTKL